MLMLTVTTWDFRGFGGFQLQKLRLFEQ
jgi:hypothetical protein